MGFDYFLSVNASHKLQAKNSPGKTPGLLDLLVLSLELKPPSDRHSIRHAQGFAAASLAEFAGKRGNNDNEAAAVLKVYEL